MNSNNETNTYTESPSTTLPHFWRNKLTWRSTSTGMNQNVIGTYSPYNSKQEIILHMRMNIVPYTDKRRHMIPEELKNHDYFMDVVNDCMKNIWHGDRGYVFSDSQLKEVMRILVDINVKWSDKDECYYCWK